MNIYAGNNPKMIKLELEENEACKFDISFYFFYLTGQSCKNFFRFLSLKVVSKE